MRLLVATALVCAFVAASLPAVTTQSCSTVTACKSTVLQQGSKGACVTALQQAVRATPDGDFGPKTDAAVKAYQRSKGLTADGIVGPKTWGAIIAARCATPAPRPPTPTPPSGQNCAGTPTAAVKLIKQFEGFRSKAYPDPKTGGEPWTIGYGTTRYSDGTKVKQGDTITQAQATRELASFVTKSVLPQLRKIPYWGDMNDNQRSALISFAYNVGPYFYGKSGYTSITTVLKNKQWSDVPATLYKYRNPGSSVEAGLARRRKAEGALWHQAPGPLSCS